MLENEIKLFVESKQGFYDGTYTLINVPRSTCPCHQRFRNRAPLHFPEFKRRNHETVERGKSFNPVTKVSALFPLQHVASTMGFNLTMEHALSRLAPCHPYLKPFFMLSHDECTQYQRTVTRCIDDYMHPFKLYVPV